MQSVETGVFKMSSRTFLVLNRKLTIAVTIITERTHNFSFAEITTVHDHGGWLKHCVWFFFQCYGLSLLRDQYEEGLGFAGPTEWGDARFWSGPTAAGRTEPSYTCMQS